MPETDPESAPIGRDTVRTAQRIVDDHKQTLVVILTVNPDGQTFLTVNANAPLDSPLAIAEILRDAGREIEAEYIAKKKRAAEPKGD
jgi:hypothetical protein